MSGGLYKKYFKRLIDFILSLIGLIVLSPIMIIAATLIKINLGSPVIFKQERPGKDGKIFKVYKFRTMRTETERNGKPLSDMERMTRVGSFLRKTSIDELPQLINIIRGEMSFIGPRPLLVQYLEYYTPEQMRRHEVLPGISGWAQVNGRNTIDWQKRFEYDVFYVDNLSLILDLRILFWTVYKVLNRKDVNSSEENTMEAFTGRKVED